MNKKTKYAKKYAIIAGICMAILVVYAVILFINNIEYYSVFWMVIKLIALALFTVALFLNNKPIALGAAIAYTILKIYYFISFFSVSNLLYLLSGGTLTLIILFAIKKNAVVLKIWFVAGTVLFLSNLITWIKFDYFYYFKYTWMDILITLVNVVGFIMIGLWCKEDIVIPSESATEFTTSDTQTVNVHKISSIGGADRLKICKELLDSGTITQEEFDEKKKQILNL